MARHHRDLMFCRQLPGIAVGSLCKKCDGKCVICDSLVQPEKAVRICDECNFGSSQGHCIICNGKGVSSAYYCRECTGLEKDRDGCPKISTGIRPPGSLLKPPSTISGLRQPASQTANGKRKLEEDSSEAGARVSSLATGRQIKVPVPKMAAHKVETIHAGRRSSQGFRVTPKQENRPVISALPVPTAAAKPFTAGRVAPKNAAKPGAARRLPPSRTATTKGRANTSSAPGAPAVSNLPPPGSIKRRRIDASADTRDAGHVPASDASSRVHSSPSLKIFSAGSDDLNVDEDEDSDDDDDEKLGPVPTLHVRPDNDVKGRLQDLEAWSAYMIKRLGKTRRTKKLLSVKLESNSTQVTQLEQEIAALEAKIQDLEKRERALQEALSECQRQIKEEKRRHEDETDDQKRQFKRMTEQMRDDYRLLQKANSEQQELLEAAKASLQAKRDECVRLEAAISKLTSNQLELESTCRILRTKLEHLEDVLSEREIRIAELEEDVASCNHAIEVLETKLRSEETMRRRLHNAIQELKGNIRVFCRVRPLLGDEKAAAASLPISFPECDDNNEIELVQSSENALGKATSKAFPFKFDRVFAPDSSQDAVFEDVSQLIQSALDGYPVCIFAYGQTGSGKTHTMQGPDSISLSSKDEHILGIIPRAVKQIYENTNKLAERGWEYTLEGQFLEIYNETLQDLLAPTGRGAQTNDKQAKLDIYQDSEGHTRVKNVTTVKVDSAERVHWLLARAADNRTVAATNCNERSSRSHSVFTLFLRGTNALTGESSSGVLNLIDLAGSERLANSGSSGDRLKETQAINKSLACLGDVIAALAKGSRHIPYRNSKLTHLLQESLGAGNSKTLMFVCVNPSPGSAQESLCSLQFATKVNSCQIGTARRQAA
ncbi:kinesin-like nuclear fusion protein [Coemansia thaxteri]|uniref:Kinesin-like protein n=1 Tax=Coemansia thaxteri TaxID=2663907 RepID=A0A9W8EKV8_9FUNG|nr:kinesin-like nuclear fusion protein [Coemansia thaxteri]KAJ2485788.1 kinesin-like nuclear fusion protein [Coemansia sp. RSA 2320]